MAASVLSGCDRKVMSLRNGVKRVCFMGKLGQIVFKWFGHNVSKQRKLEGMLVRQKKEVDGRSTGLFTY